MQGRRTSTTEPSLKLTTPPISSREGAAAKVSEEILSNVPLVDVKKVVVVGSGGLSIGQAGEFDYSGNLFYPRLYINLSM
jgi:carbamoyl-phosphate synthase large subunit